MKLFTQLWNPEGQKTALLIHGIGSDSATWGKIAGYLSENGYKVIAPDLRGHGNSERSARYGIRSWAKDVIETVNSDVDLIIGHSLGGLIAAAVSPKLKAKQTILIDPALSLPRWGLISVISKLVLLGTISTASPEKIRKFNPWLSDEDIEIEMNAVRRWDRKTIYGLKAEQCRQVMKRFLVYKPSTAIIRPKFSVLINHRVSRLLVTTGMKFIVLPDGGHNLHRTHHDTFVDSIREFIEQNVDTQLSVA